MPERVVEQQDREEFLGIESARAYAEHSRSPMMQRGYHEIADRIGELGVDGRFLEVGAGPAVLTAIIARAIPQAHITAVELSPAMITVAGEEVDVVVGQAAVLPEETFRVVAVQPHSVPSCAPRDARSNAGAVSMPYGTTTQPRSQTQEGPPEDRVPARPVPWLGSHMNPQRTSSCEPVFRGFRQGKKALARKGAKML